MTALGAIFCVLFFAVVYLVALLAIAAPAVPRCAEDEERGR